MGFSSSAQRTLLTITGSTGLIGTALAEFLRGRGFEIRRLVRSRDVAAGAGADFFWDPSGGFIDKAALEGVDGVVHLAGESIAAGRWTAARKERILDSRVNGTRVLCEALAGLASRPRTLIAASAMGYYGDRGDDVLREAEPAGDLFLSRVTELWENATAPAANAGIRVVNLRLGLVISGRGGALKQMLLPFKLGLGGRVGNGRQWVSWIAMGDLVRAIEHVIATGDVSGPVNTVAPNPVTNANLARTLARVLRRPALLPLPRLAVEAVFGQMGRELLLTSARLSAEKLLSSGFSFHHEDLESALRSELRKL